MARPIRILSLFSGIGGFERGLQLFKEPYEIVGFSETEEATADVYSAINSIPSDRNLGDITQVNKGIISEHDLMVWGFPCQDISIGNVTGKGLKGNKSGLYREGLDILAYCKPTYSVIENVANLATEAHKEDLNKILNDLKELGYDSHYEVYNAKNYGIPQNRARIFIVSVKHEYNDGLFWKYTNYPFPMTKWWEYINPLDTRRLTPRQSRILQSVLNGKPEVKVEGDVSLKHTVITVRPSGIRFQNNWEHPTITNYGRGGGNFTILAYEGHVGGITPKQCFKLQGFEYTDYTIAKALGVSESKLYTMAGNSVVPIVAGAVLADIMKSFRRYTENGKL